MRARLSGLGSLLGTAMRGLWARRLLTAGSVLLAAISVAAAVVGPMYQSAAASSYLVSKLRSDPPVQTGVVFDYAPAATPAQGYASAVREASQLASRTLNASFGPPTVALWTHRLPTVDSGVGTLMARPGACAHLAVVGRCPRRPGEAIVLRADSQITHVSIGGHLRISGLPTPLTVVGIYSPHPFDARFWLDPADLVSVPEQPTGNGIVTYQPAPFIVAPATFARLSPATWYVRAARRLELPPQMNAGRLAAAVQATRRPLPEALSMEPGNQLRAIQRELAAREATARSTVAPAVVSVVVVALVLLLRLLAAAMDLRRGQLALASLRGFSRRQMWLLGMVEPVLMVVVATPLGLLGGVLGARALGSAWLVPGLPVGFGWASGLAALGVVVVTLAVAAFVVRDALGEPLSSQISAVRRPGRTTRWGRLLQLCLVAAAVAVLAATLAHTHRSSPDAADLALPILLAAATGLLVTLAAQALARWWASYTARRRGTFAYLASRTISRRREGTLVILPLTAALAIAVFATGVFGAAAAWRASDAATLVGAARSYATKLTIDQAVALTHRVDPQGRWLMAVGAEYTAQGERLVVDTPRLARVGVWPSSWTPGLDATQVAHALAPKRPSVVLTGSRLAVTIDNDVSGRYRPLTASFAFLTPAGRVRDVLVGPFPRGTSTASARLPGCAGGCLVQQVSFGGPAGLSEPMTGSLRVTGVLVDGRPVPTALRLPWRTAQRVLGTPQAVLGQPHLVPGGLAVRFSSRSAQSFASISPDDVPLVRPVVVGRSAQLDVTGRLPGGVLRLGTDESVPLDVRPVATAESMPILGPTGMLVDYTMLTRDVPVTSSITQVFVLARPDLPPAVVEGLSSAGITSYQTLSGARAVLDQDAFALALRLYLVVTAAVIALAAAGLGANLAVQLPARRRDAASLRVVGLRRRSILSAVTTEFFVLVGAAALAGIGAGSLAQYVVVRTVTLGYADSEHTPRLLAALDFSQIGGLVLVVAAGLFAAGAAVAALTVRGARTASLRENEG